jgi:hypothetical protein
MRKPFRVAVTSVFSALALATASPAPAGPGDADPIGTNPQALIHAPTYWTHGTKTCNVWMHSFWMPSGPESFIYLNNWNSMCYWTAYSITDRGDGWWDECFTIDMSVYNLHAGQNITWLGTCEDLGTSTQYTATTALTHVQ